MKDNVVACLQTVERWPEQLLPVRLVLPAITNNNCGGDQPKHGNITTQCCINQDEEYESNQRSQNQTHPIPKSREDWPEKLLGLPCTIIKSQSKKYCPMKA
jgi:hypothetical protein